MNGTVGQVTITARGDQLVGAIEGLEVTLNDVAVRTNLNAAQAIFVDGVYLGGSVSLLADGRGARLSAAHLGMGLEVLEFRTIAHALAFYAYGIVPATRVGLV